MKYLDNNTKLNLIISRIVRKHEIYWLFSFLLGSLCMFLCLSYAGVLSTGKYCILEGDAAEIYVPVIRNLCRDIFQGDSIYYSWNQSLGMNTSLSLAYYGGYNPIHLLYLLFYHSDPNVITAIVIVLKVGLAALSFQLYERYVLKIEDGWSIVFSVLYSMCSFQVTYNITNFIWMDALYILPLVIIFLTYNKKKGKFIFLTITYAYIFIVHFYMGYVVGITSFLFFLIHFFRTSRKERLLYLARFLLSVLLAMLISAMFWLPAAMFLINNHASDSQTFSSLGVYLPGIVNQLFLGNNSLMRESLPNIYCGVLSFILLPVFFGDKHIDKRKKVEWGGVLLFLLLSCMVLPLYQIWHAFDAPDGWPFRFSYVISFTVVSIAAMELKSIAINNKKDNKEIRFKKSIPISILLSVTIYILLYLIGMFVGFGNNGEVINDLLFGGINLVLMMLWCGILGFMIKSNTNSSIIALALLISSLECIGNGYASFYRGNKNDGVPGNSEYMFYSWEKNQRELMDYLEKDNDVYRVNYMGDFLTNSDTYSGYLGLSDFSTTENANVRNTMESLGFATSPKVTRNFGITDASKMILGVKYDVLGYLGRIAGTDEQNIQISKVPFHLSIGYAVDDQILEFEFKEGDSFDNNNNLLSFMTGEDIIAFEAIPESAVQIEENGLIIKQADEASNSFEEANQMWKNGFLFSVNDGKSNDAFATIYLPDEEENMYLYIDNEKSLLLADSMIVSGGWENITETGGILSLSYIKALESVATKEGIRKGVTIYAAGVDKQMVRSLRFARLDYKELEKAYSILKKEQLQISEFRNGYISGRIATYKDGEVLFLSIPYDDKWEIKLNGKTVECVPLLDDSFIGIKLPKEGQYEIEMKYHISGLKEGRIMTGIGGIILLLYSFLQVRDNKKKSSV